MGSSYDFIDYSDHLHIHFSFFLNNMELDGNESASDDTMMKPSKKGRLSHN